MNNILKNPFFYFKSFVESIVGNEGGLDTGIVMLMAKFNMANLFIEPILTGALLFVGLKLLYNLLKDIDAIAHSTGEKR